MTGFLVSGRHGFVLLTSVARGDVRHRVTYRLRPQGQIRHASARTDFLSMPT